MIHDNLPISWYWPLWLKGNCDWLAMNPVAINSDRSFDNQTANPSGVGSGCAAAFFFGRMPKRKRITLKGLTSISYKTIISIKEITAIIKYFDRIPVFQRITDKPTQRMMVWWKV